MPITWKPSLATGVPVIDAQHQELVARAGLLIDAMRDGRGDREVARLFRFLGTYVRMHFAAEEALIAERSPHELPAHRLQHARMRRRVVELRRRLPAEGATLGLIRDVNELVCGWFFDHIVREDATIPKNASPRVLASDAHDARRSVQARADCRADGSLPARPAST